MKHSFIGIEKKGNFNDAWENGNQAQSLTRKRCCTLDQRSTDSPYIEKDGILFYLSIYLDR